MPPTLLKSQQAFGGNGWNPAAETWEYVSVDDPTGVFRVNADVTGKYSIGMRLKMTNGGNVIYGIITAVGAYTGGYTSITFLHEIDPTDSLALYLLANSAITLPFYSFQKIPFGFPLSPLKWTVKVTDSNAYEVSATANTWYNITNMAISVPIGVWSISYFMHIYSYKASITSVNIFSTLSTANNSESNSSFTYFSDLIGATSTLAASDTIFINNILSLSSKTILYANIKTSTSGGANIGSSTSVPKTIYATCAYL